MIFNKKRGYKTLLILVLISISLSLIFVTGCNQINRRSTAGDSKDYDYYQGYKGTEMAFTQGLPPSKIYYYGDAYDNTFDVNVEVANLGASFSRGAIFISGYDPTMIQIEGITPQKAGGDGCVLDIGNIGLGSFGGALRCDDFLLGVNNRGDIDFAVEDVFGPAGSSGDSLSLDRLLKGADFSYKKSGDSNVWSVDFANPNLDIEYANHGRLLAVLFSGIEFDDYYGVEYGLEGDTYEYPGGELAYVNFDGNIVSWPPGLDKTTQSFMITNCFYYATYAAPVVCIDPAPYSEDKKVCRPTPYTGTRGQAAPVAVTLIEQENTPRQAIFTIHIRNTGSGKVYDPGKLVKCSPYFPGRVTNEDLNVVYIGDIRVSGDLQRLKCSPHDYVRLDSRTGEGIVTCTYEIPFSGLRSAYETPLVVELWYGYSKSMEKKVLIKRAI